MTGIHNHSHAESGNSHPPASFDRAFAIGAALNMLFVVIEAGYGWKSNSLALVADAGHNFSDVIGLLLAWGAATLSKRKPTLRRTYGLRRSSILAALTNAVLLLAAIGAIAWEAYGRLRNPQPVNSTTVMIVAAVGILINSATALLFARGRKGDINIRGAYLHMVADASVSAAVVMSGFLVGLTQLPWIDPATSLLIVVVIGAGTWALLRDSVNLALDSVPAGIDPKAVQEMLETVPGVSAVHDLHIWGMSTTEVAMTAHIIKEEISDDDAMLNFIAGELKEHHGIAHPTIQIERGNGPTPCPLTDPTTV